MSDEKKLPEIKWPEAKWSSETSTDPVKVLLDAYKAFKAALPPEEEEKREWHYMHSHADLRNHIMGSFGGIPHGVMRSPWSPYEMLSREIRNGHVKMTRDLIDASWAMQDEFNARWERYRKELDRNVFILDLFPGHGPSEARERLEEAAEYFVDSMEASAKWGAESLESYSPMFPPPPRCDRSRRLSELFLRYGRRMIDSKQYATVTITNL